MKNTKILLLSIWLLVLNAMGIIGYMWIEGWEFNEAFYMTVITLSTVGFGEIKSLSPEGRYFTVVIIFVGLSTLAYVSRSLLQELAENFQSRGKRIMEKKISGVDGHTIVLGFGRMGRSLCDELHINQKKFIVIEKAPKLIESLRETDYLWIEGDAADDENLKKARVEHASNLVSVIDNDADGLFASVAAKSMNPNIHVVVRANSESAKRKMMLAGADEVVLPFIMSGQKVAQRIVNPEIEELVELSNVGDRYSKLQVIDLEVYKDSWLNGKCLKNCGLRRNGLIVVGLKKSNGFVFAPDADMLFEEGDTIVALGTHDSLKSAKSFIRDAS